MIERLNAPEMVVSVQELFGIKYLKLEDIDGDEQDAKNKENQYTCSNGSSGGTDDEGFNELSGSSSSGCGRRRGSRERNDERDISNREVIKPFEVTNRFWYYLFVIGTEMGDEIFYVTMIPFWFWNVDGAVGRRVVFVWSIVMYVGT